MEVMGLMLGEFVDEYTVRVVDVFAMPQSGTGVSVEAVDHVFQTNMLDMLKQTGRCFEALNPRAIAVVVDPIQSVKGKVVDRTLDLAAFVTPGVATSYGELVCTEAWCEGMARHATLMVRAAIVFLAHHPDGSTSDVNVSIELVRTCLHLGCRCGCRLSVGLGEQG
ncbi:hypothetical protein BHM03_00035005 [Ensete ventricosum]|nr:hypothetical protein BHM03_00035005 [Ensete ventricosum]